MSFDAGSVFEAALKAHQAGDTDRAAAGYRMTLQLKPDFAPAQHYLGLVLYQQGETEQAIALIRRALTLDPRLAGAHYNLGNIFRELRRPKEAQASYRAALRSEPRNPATLHNLGTLLYEVNILDEAETVLRQLLALEPRHAEGRAALGALLLRTSRAREALNEFHEARKLAPRNPQLVYNLGVALLECGDARQAEAAFRTAVQIDPSNAEAVNNLGNALLAQHRHRDAVAILEDLVDRHPAHAGYRGNLAIAYHGVGRLTDSEQAYRRALTIEPENATLHANLGTVLRDQGRMNEAIAVYRQALALDRTLWFAQSNLLFALSFKEDADLAEVLAEHRRFDEVHTRLLTRAALPHANMRDPEKRLRVGYLSSDFRRHPCGFFLLPVLENHDASQIESFCYSTGKSSDAFTERFRSAANHWREVSALTDQALAETIRHDSIDILVECSGHMANHRLLAVARKPAPVQVSFPMYPNTTGMEAVDYRFADPYVAPASADDLYTETLIRLPETHLCYEPSDRLIEPAATMPMKRNGYVTFGCFNNISKLGPRTVALWSRLLRAIPSARLTLKWLGLNNAGDNPVVAGFAAHGIGPDRLQLSGWVDNHYEPYRDIDICLDPVRAAGGTTTCDALWMGVPVIALYDEKPLSRLGLGLLSNMGLEELVASDEEGYERIAMSLALDPQKLAALRSGLRERFMASPLMDGPRYTRFVEEAYRRIWRSWCRNG